MYYCKVPVRRIAGVVDRSGLENRRACECPLGSNPRSSSILKALIVESFFTAYKSNPNQKSIRVMKRINLVEFKGIKN